ncbi:hypothetical protein FOZ62_007733, partial [Perkinsus olseni]
VSLRSVPGHSSISANEWADEQAAKGASMREVSAGTEISVRTLRRYQGKAGCLSLRKWWSDKRASLCTSVDESLTMTFSTALPMLVCGFAGKSRQLAVPLCSEEPQPQPISIDGTLGTTSSPPLLEQARKRVKGGVSYHLYKLIVDLKRRRFFFRSSNGVRGSLLDICMKTAAARTKAGRSRWQQPGQKPRGWRKTQKSSVEALEQEDPERVISMEAQSITQKFLVKNGDGGLPCKHYACRALRRVRNHWYFIYYPDSDDRSGYFDIAGVREVFAE